MGKWRIHQVASVDGDNVVIQSGRSVRGNVTGNITGDGNTVVQSGSDGTYVNGRRVAATGAEINIINGTVYADGKRVD